MGHLAHSTDVQVFQLEDETSIDALTTRVETCESRQEVISEVMALKVEVLDLRNDVDYLKSTDFTSLFESAVAQDVPTTFEMPPTTTRDVLMDDVVVVESEVGTNEVHLRERYEAIFVDLADLEDAMFYTSRQTSLRDTIMPDSSAVAADVTPDIDALTDGATE
ncbi:uncharacterized protein LOC125825735 [Solanum verrucosum]|uniref:uncharacterized protein LOC125825735 n=1 Tax=Solanum verrucosum TaxID=315347 RepID=UPI0020D0D9CE|nr:uncharacterized protein LOC125825735 [Solanum verrucosum]